RGAADLVDPQTRMRPVGAPARARRPRDFLHRDAVFEIAKPRPAPFLLDRDPVYAELAELGPQVARKGVAAVDLLGPRRDPVGGKAAHAVAQQIGRLAEREIKAA